jgi:hypothetical protein
MGAEHNMVIIKVRERLRVSKRETQKSDLERLNLKNMNDVEGKKQNRLKISSMCAGLET